MALSILLEELDPRLYEFPVVFAVVFFPVGGTMR